MKTVIENKRQTCAQLKINVNNIFQLIISAIFVRDLHIIIISEEIKALYQLSFTREAVFFPNNYPIVYQNNNTKISLFKNRHCKVESEKPEFYQDFTV